MTETEQERPRDLPDFKKPPVIEVALSVQFERLVALSSLRMGLLWREFRSRFPREEQHPPLDSVQERFGVPKGPTGMNVRIEMTRVPPVPRSWFLNETGNRLLQIQPDRFGLNWRKANTDDAYPRFELLLDAFKSEWARFSTFVETEKIGELAPSQCEVTYVNHLEAGLGWNNFNELDKVLTVWRDSFSDSFLPQAEDTRLALRFVIPAETGEPIGRLHVAVDPAFRASDSKPVLVMTLTARGVPVGEGLEGVLAFMNTGREWIVRGFASVTTPEMHSLWERCDGE